MVTPANEGDDASRQQSGQNPPGGQEINASDIFRGRAGSTPPGERQNIIPPGTSATDGAAEAANKAAKPKDGRPQLGEHSLDAKREGAGGDAGPLIHRTLPERPQGVKEANQMAIEHANMSTPTGVAKPVMVELRDGGTEPMTRIKADDSRTVLYSRPGPDGKDQYFRQEGRNLVQSDKQGQPITNGETLSIRNIQLGRQFGQPGDVPPRPPAQSEQQVSRPTRPAEKAPENTIAAKVADIAKPADLAKPSELAKPSDLAKPVNDAAFPKGAKPSDSPDGGGPGGKPADLSSGLKGLDQDSGGKTAATQSADQATDASAPAGKPAEAESGSAGDDGAVDQGVKTEADGGAEDSSTEGKSIQQIDGLIDFLSNLPLVSKLMDALNLNTDGAMNDPRVQEACRGLDPDQIEQLKTLLADGTQSELLDDPVLQGKLQELMAIVSRPDARLNIQDAIAPDAQAGADTLMTAVREIDRVAQLLEAEGRTSREAMNEMISRTLDGDGTSFAVPAGAAQELINRLQANLTDRGTTDGSILENGEPAAMLDPGDDAGNETPDQADDATEALDGGESVNEAGRFETLPPKPHEKLHATIEVDDVPVDAGPDAEELAELAQKKLEEDKRREREEEEKRLDKERKERERKNKRGTYRVRQGDSLVTIAQSQCNDASVAPLIYDINRGQIPEKFQGVRRVAWLKVNQVLALPSENDVANYKRGPVRHAGVDMSVPAGDPGPTMVSGAPAGFVSPEAELAAQFGVQWSGGVAKPNEEITGTRTDAVKQKIRENREAVLKALAVSGDKPAFTTQNRIRYVCRIGDTLRSIALRHPALQDVKLWELVAVVNELSTEVNQKNDPLTKLSRGQILFLPTPEDIQKWRAGTFHNERSFLLHQAAYVEMACRSCPDCKRPTIVSAIICPGCGINMDGDDSIFATPVSVTAEPQQIEPVTPRAQAHSYARDVWSSGPEEEVSNAPSFSKINFPPGTPHSINSGGKPSEELEPPIVDDDDDQRATSDNLGGYYEYLSRQQQLLSTETGTADLSGQSDSEVPASFEPAESATAFHSEANPETAAIDAGPGATGYDNATISSDPTFDSFTAFGSDNSGTDELFAEFEDYGNSNQGPEPIAHVDAASRQPQSSELESQSPSQRNAGPSVESSATSDEVSHDEPGAQFSNSDSNRDSETIAQDDTAREDANWSQYDGYEAGSAPAQFPHHPPVSNSTGNDLESGESVRQDHAQESLPIISGELEGDSAEPPVEPEPQSVESPAAQRRRVPRRGRQPESLPPPGRTEPHSAFPEPVPPPGRPGDSPEPAAPISGRKPFQQRGRQPQRFDRMVDPSNQLPPDQVDGAGSGTHDVIPGHSGQSPSQETFRADDPPFERQLPHPSAPSHPQHQPPFEQQLPHPSAPSHPQHQPPFEQQLPHPSAQPHPQHQPSFEQQLPHLSAQPHPYQHWDQSEHHFPQHEPSQHESHQHQPPYPSQPPAPPQAVHREPPQHPYDQHAHQQLPQHPHQPHQPLQPNQPHLQHPYQEPYQQPYAQQQTPHQQPKSQQPNHPPTEPYPRESGQSAHYLQHPGTPSSSFQDHSGSWSQSSGKASPSEPYQHPLAERQPGYEYPARRSFDRGDSMHELQQPDYTGSLPADPRDLQGRSYGAHESSSGYTHPRDARGGYEDFLQKPDYSSDLQGGAWPVEEPKSGGYQHPAIERQYGEPESGGSQFHDLQGQVFAQNSQPQPDGYSDPYLDDQNATQIMKPDFNPHAPYVPTPAPSMYAPVENNPAPNVPEPAPPVMPLPPPLPSYLRSNTKRPVPDVIYDDAPAAPEPAVKPQYLSVNARIITEGAPEAGKTYRLTLEGLTDRWVTLAVYEISAEVILHHIFDSSGQKKTRRIALPVRQAIQLAENDLRGNWHQYQVMYMQGI